MHDRIPTKCYGFAWRRLFFFGLIAFFSSVELTQAQDVAEAARQEQARKAAKQQIPPHVYTTEELKQKKILTSEDQARAEARNKKPYQPGAEQNAESRPTEANPEPESLGTAARRYREEKAAREAEEAAKKNFAPFPYDIPTPSVAAPTPAVFPGRRSLPPVNSLERATPKSLPNSSPSKSGTEAGRRISPFQPRPLVVAPPAFSGSLGSKEVMRDTVQPRPKGSIPSREKYETQVVQVQRGESWWRLANQYLGSGSKWPELRRLNDKMNGPAELLLAESLVVVPIRSDRGEVSQSGTVIVKPNDSLWKLARENLGRGSEWPCLAHANPQISDYKHLAIGTSMQLPTAEALETCRKENRDKLQR
jgi:nucleoid-associated protein YgaU